MWKVVMGKVFIPLATVESHEHIQLQEQSGNAFQFPVWEEKELAVYAADICPFPMFQRLLAPPEKDIAYISALMYSAQGWTYDLSQFSHTGLQLFVVIEWRTLS